MMFKLRLNILTQKFLLYKYYGSNIVSQESHHSENNLYSVLGCNDVSLQYNEYILSVGFEMTSKHLVSL